MVGGDGEVHIDCAAHARQLRQGLERPRNVGGDSDENVRFAARVDEFVARACRDCQSSQK
ncbi:hypothetical protein TL10_23395 [Mycolicibacterium llatzerense]|uniref:Uncharacterized protein n=1 Tax=Mycolicibacterium llatzerense TaxID=280871 RepID=A0A0D1L0R9_9MYCO|nr:hypothetical protein TL10_23395 [Mycolicibacterium llatzerense]